ncbi:MAG: DUF4326 domain-containing protein [Nanoarchaeota archaeon]
MDNIINIKSGVRYDLYIGRANKTYNLLQSKWANPFIIGRDGERSEVLNKYHKWILNQPELLNDLYELDSKILACWCDIDKGEQCHGQILLGLREFQKKNLLTMNDIKLLKPLNKTKYKIAVIGSRSVQDKKIVFDYLDSKYDKIEMIVSGGANGPDSYGAEWAAQKGFPCLIFNAQWHDKNNIYNKGAGYRRNHDIIKSCDICVSFYDGISRGTKHSMELCKQYNKKLIIIDCKKPEIDAIESTWDLPKKEENEF